MTTAMLKRIIIISSLIILTVFVSHLFSRREHFIEEPTKAITSVLAPDYSFDTVLEKKVNALKVKARNDLLYSLAKEHIPILVCAYYNFVNNPDFKTVPEGKTKEEWDTQNWIGSIFSLGLQKSFYQDFLPVLVKLGAKPKQTFAGIQKSIVLNDIIKILDKENGFNPSAIKYYQKGLDCKVKLTDLVNQTAPVVTASTSQPAQVATAASQAVKAPSVSTTASQAVKASP